MKKQILVKTIGAVMMLLIFEFSAGAQIQDIKKNSNQNKSSSSDRSSSGSNDIGSAIFEGCLSSIFDALFAGCLSPGPERTNNHKQQKRNKNVQNNVPIIPDTSNVAANQIQNPDSSIIVDNQNLNPVKNDDAANDIVNNQNAPDNYNNEPAEFSLDIKANFGLGFEFLSDNTYTYVDFLPELRANLAWFLIDFRYNMLTENTGGYPDAFKTWDLTFLFNLKASENTKIFFGAGMHYEDYSETTFLEFHGGSKIKLFEGKDYLNIEGRAVVDFNESNNPDDDVYPFSEIAVNYNKGIINSKNLNAYISLGAFYHNYYHSTDIWALQAGFIFNWHN